MSKEHYPHLLALVGKRVRLRFTNDPYTELKAGDEGVADHVDDDGTLFVKWDSGSSLGLNAEFGDRWVVLD
jgi:hypothetical protein